MQTRNHTRLLGAAIVLALAALAGCSKEHDKKPGQALASVNGEEITTMQMNEELMRANVRPEQQAVAKKQLLEALIDRQLLQSQAEKEKIDRDPNVVQSVERAKSIIVAQAYLQKHLGNPVKPTRQEIEDYYAKNPQFFAHRKQFNMSELMIAARDMNPQVKSAADAAHSLDELAAWFEANKVRYSRGQVMRASTDLPGELAARIEQIPKGKLFIVKELDRTLFLAVNDMKEEPVALDTAAPQIEQFLLNKKNKESAQAEVARLRASAKIAYLNGQAPAPAARPGAAVPAAVAPGAAAPAVPAAADAATAALPTASAERGIAGLK